MTIELSAIIPTLNRADSLALALESFTQQSMDQNKFEVLVIDNGSHDHTKNVTELYQDKIKNLSYYYIDTPGLHSARHFGLSHSRAETLFFCDDDATLSKDCLKQIVQTFLEYPTQLVGGKILPEFAAEPPAWLLEKWKRPGKYGQVLFHLSLLHLGDKICQIPPHLVYGCNFSIKKALLYACGGFHPDGFDEQNMFLRGDGETHISRYMQEHNLTTIYNPDILVWHRIEKERLTKEYFLSRMYRAGISSSYKKLRQAYLNQELPKKYDSCRELIKMAYYNLLVGKHSSLKRCALKSYWQGYYAHRMRALTDPDLQKWIVKENYF